MEVDATNPTEMGHAEVHKGSGLAVAKDKKRWYVAECKPTRERTICSMLNDAGFESFVASRIEEKVYKSRNRYKKETAIIPGKVFVHTTEDKLMEIMLSYSSVHRFMLNHAAKDRAYAFVSDVEMQMLQFMLGRAENPVHITAASLKVNQKVKVLRGTLSGLEGLFYKEGRAAFVVIKLTMGISHYVFTEVPIEDIQVIE